MPQVRKVWTNLKSEKILPRHAPSHLLNRNKSFENQGKLVFNLFYLHHPYVCCASVFPPYKSNYSVNISLWIPFPYMGFNGPFLFFVSLSVSQCCKYTIIIIISIIIIIIITYIQIYLGLTQMLKTEFCYSFVPTTSQTSTSNSKPLR